MIGGKIYRPVWCNSSTRVFEAFSLRANRDSGTKCFAFEAKKNMKASELVKVLKELIKKHGDQEVFAGGEDYPGKVGAVTIATGDAYTAKDAFKIHAREPSMG